MICFKISLVLPILFDSGIQSSPTDPNTAKKAQLEPAAKVYSHCIILLFKEYKKVLLYFCLWCYVHLSAVCWPIYCRMTHLCLHLFCVLQAKRHVRKHLFSDTDTDNAMTEVSWLRESSRKPKPQVTKYTRQALSKPKAAPPQSKSKF